MALAVIAAALAVFFLVIFPAMVRSEARNKRARELVARADCEHTAVMRGDVTTGIYGQFPPSV